MIELFEDAQRTLPRVPCGIEVTGDQVGVADVVE
jgi:hypothetical protein